MRNSITLRPVGIGVYSTEPFLKTINDDIGGKNAATEGKIAATQYLNRTEGYRKPLSYQVRSIGLQVLEIARLAPSVMLETLKGENYE